MNSFKSWNLPPRPLIPWNRQAPFAHYAGWCASTTYEGWLVGGALRNRMGRDLTVPCIVCKHLGLCFPSVFAVQWQREYSQASCNGLTWHFTGQNGQGLDRSIIHKNQGLIKYLPCRPGDMRRRLVWKRTELAESSCPAGSGQWLVEDGQRRKEGGGPEWWGGLQDALL
jgi:hypothetical protein